VFSTLTLSTIQLQEDLVCSSDQFLTAWRLMVALSDTTEEFAHNLLPLFEGEGVECIEYALGARALPLALPLFHPYVHRLLTPRIDQGHLTGR
jgi:hypothetical protein